MGDKVRQVLCARSSTGFQAGSCIRFKGDLKEFCSDCHRKNWRLIIRYDEQTNSASDIDLIDYPSFNASVCTVIPYIRTPVALGVPGGGYSLAKEKPS
jgi:hypothetical protein